MTILSSSAFADFTEKHEVGRLGSLHMQWWFFILDANIVFHMVSVASHIHAACMTRIPRELPAAGSACGILRPRASRCLNRRDVHTQRIIGFALQEEDMEAVVSTRALQVSSSSIACFACDDVCCSFIHCVLHVWLHACTPLQLA